MLSTSLSFKNFILNHKQRLPCWMPKHSPSHCLFHYGALTTNSTKKSSQLQPGLHFHRMQCKKQELSAVTAPSLTCFTEYTAETSVGILILPTVCLGSRHGQQHNLQSRQTGILSDSSSQDTTTILSRLTCKDLETHSGVHGKPQEIISAKCCSQQ